MKSETRLDLAVFQLTPTRTRCDLVIMANGKTEKIASGLVNPFLSHLRTAQDQIAIGGYSIKLEPDPCAEATWFTKGTVERFVRFVSTPGVLERVNTIESEIVQIEKAISIQGHDSLGLGNVDLHNQLKCIGSNEVQQNGLFGHLNVVGIKPTFDADAEKAIILYKPGSHHNPPESNGSKMHEESSKVQLLRVLESRKKVLQKEQAMAFARTVAAGFDIENMIHLISFAESFGASRLMEACTQYMQLWQKKHETGQWIEVETAEVLSYKTEFSPLNSSGIVLSGDAMRQKELVERPVSGTVSRVESNDNTTIQDNDRDKKLPSEHQAPQSSHEYYQGQFQQPSFPPWPLLSQPGPHGFQPYPMQPMPYYHNYPMNGQFFHPPPAPMEDPRFNTPKRKAKKKHSMNNRDSTSTSEDGSDENTLESEGESSKGRSSHKKSSHSKQKKGVVVIRNLNYIARNHHEASKNGSESSHDSEIEESKDSLSDNTERKYKSLKPSKRRDSHTKSLDNSNVHGKDEEKFSQEADTGNWQAFQSFLLRAEEKMTSVVNEEILAGEKDPHAREGRGPDLIVLPQRDCSSYRDGSIIGYDAISGKGSRTKQFVSADEIVVSSACIGMQDKPISTHFKEMEGGVGGYRKPASDAFMMYRQEKQDGISISSDPLVYCEHEHGGNPEKRSLHSVNDESFMVPIRPGSQDLLEADRRLTIDMDSVFLSLPQRSENSSNKESTRVIYEPDDLTLMLGRTRESESVGYDPAIDYDIQVPLVVKSGSERKEDDISASTNKELIKTSREKQLKSSQDGFEKKGKDATKTKMTSSRSTPLTEAQKRAEKLRNYKADLQKLKKDQEEEEMKRLEALRRERQKRIATRSGSNNVQSPTAPQQQKTRLLVKATPIAYKSSKYSDSEPGSHSPLQRLPRNISSTVANDSNKVPKTVQSNRFSISSSSLSELKKEGMKEQGRSASERTRRLSEPKGKEGMKQEGNLASERIRRLSEPKGSIARNVPEKVSKGTIQVMKRPLSEEPQSKKISAIMQLDRTKLETLPELKINTNRTTSEAVKNKSATRQQKGSGSRIPLISEKQIEKTSSFTYSDENAEVEKTVVMLENEVVSVPTVPTSEEKIDSVDKSYMDVRRNMTGVDTAVYIAIQAPPLYEVEVEHPTEDYQDGRVNSYEIVSYMPKDESQKLLDMTVLEKPYGAPYARASSLEDPASGVCSVADFCSVDQLDEINEKARIKEPKGLKKLWKFGRKGHRSGPGDGNPGPNGFIVDDQMMASTSSNDTSTLKNLLSQDESIMVGTQTKVSSSFSILSPFRGRNKDKKAVA